MSVRVEKPAFNLREKLSELDVPVGAHGGHLMRSKSPQETFDLVSAGRKNLIINGAMLISQRGSTTNSNGFGVDRFKGNVNGMSNLVTNYTIDTQAPPGFMRSLRVDVTTAESDGGNASNKFLRIMYNMEAYDCQPLAAGTPNAKPFTLSFWVKSHATGRYAVSVWVEDAGITSNFTYEIHQSDVWTYVTHTFPPISVPSWDIDVNNGLGLRINWLIGCGPDYGGGASGTEVNGRWTGYTSASLGAFHSANVLSSTDNDWRLTGVQLEVGDSATPFEHRLYAEELALCKRYYEEILLKGIPSGGYSGASGGYDNHLLGVAYAVEKRTVPTLTYDSVGNYQPGGGTGTPSTLYGHAKVLCIKTGSANSTWQPQVINSNAYAYVDAEL